MTSEANIMRGAFKLRPVEPTHGEALNAVLRFLKQDRRVAWAEHFNTGAHVVVSTLASGKTSKRFIRYAFPGCSDILGQLVDGTFLAVEIKVKTDTLSDEQAAFLITVNKNGGLAFVAHGIEDALTALNTYQRERIAAHDQQVWGIAR
jgi:hypothetical protein